MDLSLAVCVIFNTKHFLLQLYKLNCISYQSHMSETNLLATYLLILYYNLKMDSYSQGQRSEAQGHKYSV